MGIRGVAPDPDTSKSHPENKMYPYLLRDKDIKISIDGRGRALDSIFVERLWWTVKYENFYMNDPEFRDYQTAPQLN